MKPSIAIFTLTCNRLEYTQRMMASLAKHTGVEYDHFVVDNGSTDGTVDYLKQKPGRIKRLTLNTENRGISIASNQALETIGEDYDYICKLDNDCLILSDGWLETILDIAVTDPRLVLSPRVEGLFTNAGGPPRYGARMVKEHRLGLAKHLGGICVFAPASAYESFRFNENDTLHGTQDQDFSRHAVAHGYLMAYVEDLAVEHVDGTRGQVAKYPDYFREYYESWRWQRYGERLRPWSWAAMAVRRRRDRDRLLKRFPHYQATMAQPKKIVFLPQAKENPYLALLARQMARHHLGTQFDGRFSPGWLWRNRWLSGVLHLHWLEYLHGRQGGVRGLAEYLSFVFKLRLAALLGYKLGWTVHNLQPHDMSDGWVEKLCRRYVARRADAVICHSNYVKDRLKQEYGRTTGVHVIPHGNYIAWEPYQNGQLRMTKARQSLGLPSDKFIYLFFGQIRANKGLKDLVDVVDELREDARLVVAGKPMIDGNDLDVLQRHPKIHSFPAFIPDKEVQKFFAACDAVVLPFSTVTTSGSLMLALSFGKPVVVPAFGPILEIVTPDFAVTYRPNDKKALADAMKEIRSKNLAAAGVKAREAALAADWESIGKRHAEIYLELVKMGT